MHSLKQIQDAFSKHVMTNDNVSTDYVIGTMQVSGALRLDIYRNAYRERLIETLMGDYETLASLVGEDAFRRLSKTYIDKHPSSHYSLRWFGANLAGFLDYSAENGSHYWEADMAQLEWKFTEAFDAADTTTVSTSDAATISPELWPVLSATFHPSVHLIRLWWNTLDLWQAVKNEKHLPDPARLNQYTHCLLWRNNMTTQYRSLEADEAAALSAALAGENFSGICGALAEELHDHEQVPIKAAGFFKGWLSSGMIARLNT